MVEEEGAHVEVVPMGIGYIGRESFQSILDVGAVGTNVLLVEDLFKSDSLCILSVTRYEEFLMRGGGNRK